jgi:hypothetical protein
MFENENQTRLKPSVVSKRGRPQMRKVQEYCTEVQVRSFYKIFGLPLLTTSSKTSSSSTKKMASIPTIESEVGFHVEGAGKPCKTVRYPFSLISNARCNFQHRAFHICSKAFKFIFSITTPLGLLFSIKTARTKFRYVSVD